MPDSWAFEPVSRWQDILGEVLVNCPHQGAALWSGDLSGGSVGSFSGENLCIPFPGDVVLPVLGMLQVAPRAGGCLGATGLRSFT